MTKTAEPTGRFAAVKVAEDVTIDELAALLTEHRSVTIFRPRHNRHLASVAHVNVTTLDSGVRHVSVLYERATNTGRYEREVVSVGHATRRADTDPVFDFCDLGRVVRLSAEA